MVAVISWRHVVILGGLYMVAVIVPVEKNSQAQGEYACQERYQWHLETWLRKLQYRGINWHTLAVPSLPSPGTCHTSVCCLPQTCDFTSAAFGNWCLGTRGCICHLTPASPWMGITAPHRAEEGPAEGRGHTFHTPAFGLHRIPHLREHHGGHDVVTVMFADVHRLTPQLQQLGVLLVVLRDPCGGATGHVEMQAIGGGFGTRPRYRHPWGGGGFSGEGGGDFGRESSALPQFTPTAPKAKNTSQTGIHRQILTRLRYRSQHQHTTQSAPTNRHGPTPEHAGGGSSTKGARNAVRCRDHSRCHRPGLAPHPHAIFGCRMHNQPREIPAGPSVGEQCMRNAA